MDQNANTIVQSSTDYDKFQFIDANRELNRGHIENIKEAFAENGNLTRVQPILVNEKLQIIDGQHRFTACMELNEPIFYTVVEGLGINEARSMNILHQNWNVQDFARSYAATGDRNYQRYLELKEDYGFNHSIMLNYLLGNVDRTGSFKTFREGGFVLRDEEEAIKRLNILAEVKEYTLLAKDKLFAEALLKTFQNDNFDIAHFIRKVALFGEQVFHSYRSLEENLRQIEEVYNYRTNEANRVRLY